MLLSRPRALALSLATGASVLVMTGVAVVAWSSTSSVDRAAEWVGHARQVLEEIEHVELDFARAEAGKRGYILTGDTTQLRPVEAAATGVPRSLATLRTLVTDTASRRLLDSVDVLAGRRLAHVARVVATRSRGGAEAALAEMSAGYPVAQALRDALGRLEDREHAVLAEQLARERASGRAQRAALLVSLGLAAALLAWAFVARLIARRQWQGRLDAERALARAREEGYARAAMLEAVMNASDAFVCRLDREGRLRFLNGSLALAVGRPVEALLGRTLEEAEAPAVLRSVVDGALRQVLATGEPQSARLTLGTDAEPRHRLAVFTPEHDEGGAVVSVIGVATDVTALREAELAQETEHQLLAAILAQVEAEVLACDADGRITLLNPAAQRTFGGPVPRPGVGTLPTEMACYEADGLTPLAPERWPLLRALRGEAVDDVELVTMTPRHGRRTLLVSARQLLRGDGSVFGAVAVGHDVTRRRQLEDELRTAQRLEATGRMAAGVAHDFNNILMAMQVATDLMRAAAGAGLDPLRQLPVLQDGIARASLITDHLLASCRAQRHDTQLLALGPWLEGTVPALLAEAPATVRTRLWCSAELERAAVRMAPARLDWVLRSLVTNALEAMPRGGDLGVRAATVTLAAPYVHRFGTVPAGRYATLAVQDAGPGLAADVLAGLFEPFFSTKLSGEGRGLGLSTSRGIVMEAGGGIVVESTPGVGSQFTVYLPLADVPAGPMPAGAGVECAV